MAYKNIEDRRAYHRKYQREYREFMYKHKRCKECGKQDAYTLAGRKRCYDCNKKARIREALTPDVIDREVSKDKNDTIPRSMWTGLGMCYLCGAPAENGYKVCEKHHRKLIEARKIQKENGHDSAIRCAVSKTFER